MPRGQGHVRRRCPLPHGVGIVRVRVVVAWQQISAGGSGGYLLVASFELQERAKNAGAETETEEHVRT